MRSLTFRLIAVSTCFYGLFTPLFLKADPGIAPLFLSSDVRLSTSGADGEWTSRAQVPDVAYDTEGVQYLVVYEKRTGTGETEIYGQRVAAEDGTQSGEFPISAMGTPGIPAYGAFNPRVIYNSTRGHFLVLWWGDTASGTLVDNEFEIWGQLVGRSGNLIGEAFRVSSMGADGSTEIRAVAPKVAYNVTNNQYLVTWLSNTDTGAATPAYEVWGAVLGYSEVGALSLVTSQFRITTMGGEGAGDFGAGGQNAVFNGHPTDPFYFVVFHGDTNVSGHVDDETEIYGQVVLPNGDLSGSVLPISEHGPNGDLRYNGYAPNITLNTTNNEFFIVWEASDPSQPLNRVEIWGKRLNAFNLTNIADPFRISETPPLDSEAPLAYAPDLVYDAQGNRYLVAWDGDRQADSLVFGENEVWARVISGDGTLLGSEMRLSHAGIDGNAMTDATWVALAHNGQHQQFFAVWAADPATGALVDNEHEIFASALGDNSDLLVAITDGQTSAPVNTDMAFTTSVINNGPHEARMLTVTLTLPAGVTFVSAAGDGWVCTDTGPVYCDRSSLAAGATAPVITLNVQAGAVGTYSVTASVGNNIPDPNPGNNTASDSTTTFIPTPTPTPTSTPTATNTPTATATPAATAPSAATPTPTAAGSVPTVTNTPGLPVTCSLSVDRRCRGAVRKGTTCTFSTSIKVGGRGRSGVAHTMERKVGNGAFKRLKRFNSGARGAKSLVLAAAKTATYRAVFEGFVCTTRNVVVKVR